MSGFGLIIPFIWPPFFIFSCSLATGFQLPVLLAIFSCSRRTRDDTFWFKSPGDVSFRFTPIGGSAVIGGEEYYGTRTCLWRTSKRMRSFRWIWRGNGTGQTDDSVWSGWCRAGDVRTAHAQNRKAIKALLISGVLQSLLAASANRLSFCSYLSVTAICLPCFYEWLRQHGLAI